MKVAILECDNVLGKFEEEFGQYSSMIINMFTAIDSNIEFDIFACHHGEYPSDLDAYDFYVTTGSKAGAYEDEPWIRQLIAFVRELNEAGKKLIGICFGHQAMAVALYGRVERSSKGWGVGIANNRIVAAPKWMRDKREELNIIVSHRDQVVELPPNAQVIAESDFCPNFVVQWNDHFLSIQGHPEWNKGYSRALINERSDIIPKECVEAGLNSLINQPDNPLFTRWILDFVKSG